MPKEKEKEFQPHSRFQAKDNNYLLMCFALQPLLVCGNAQRKTMKWDVDAMCLVSKINGVVVE